MPFVLVTGLLLDNDSFRNVEVTNGKYINDGDRNIIIGFGLPGLKDNLDLMSWIWISRMDLKSMRMLRSFLQKSP